MNNNLEVGEDIVIVAHLMNMARHETYGLIQETVYEDYTPELQREQVNYAGTILADLALHDKLLVGYTHIVEDWITHKERHDLCFLHHQDGASGLKNFWENYYYVNNCPWVRQPGFYARDIVAWVQPTKNPAILFRPTVKYGTDITDCENYQACMRFLEAYADEIVSRNIDPRTVKFPDPLSA